MSIFFFKVLSCTLSVLKLIFNALLICKTMLPRKVLGTPAASFPKSLPSSSYLDPQIQWWLCQTNPYVSTFPLYPATILPVLPLRPPFLKLSHSSFPSLLMVHYSPFHKGFHQVFIFDYIWFRHRKMCSPVELSVKNLSFLVNLIFSVTTALSSVRITSHLDRCYNFLACSQSSVAMNYRTFPIRSITLKLWDSVL